MYYTTLRFDLNPNGKIERMLDDGRKEEYGVRLLIDILKVLYARAVWSTTPMSLSDMRLVSTCVTR